MTDNFLAPLSRPGIPQQSEHVDTGMVNEILGEQQDYGTNGPENFMFDTGN